MTNIDKIEQLREICGKATPGPWKQYMYEICSKSDVHILQTLKTDDGEFVTTCNPALVSKLLDVVEAGDELFVVLAHTKGHWETVQQYRKARKALEEAGGE